MMNAHCERCVHYFIVLLYSIDFCTVCVYFIATQDVFTIKIELICIGVNIFCSIARDSSQLHECPH